MYRWVNGAEVRGYQMRHQEEGGEGGDGDEVFVPAKELVGELVPSSMHHRDNAAST